MSGKFGTIRTIFVLEVVGPRHRNIVLLQSVRPSSSGPPLNTTVTCHLQNKLRQKVGDRFPSDVRLHQDLRLFIGISREIQSRSELMLHIYVSVGVITTIRMTMTSFPLLSLLYFMLPVTRE